MYELGSKCWVSDWISNCDFPLLLEQSAVRIHLTSSVMLQDVIGEQLFGLSPYIVVSTNLRLHGLMNTVIAQSMKLEIQTRTRPPLIHSLTGYSCRDR